MTSMAEHRHRCEVRELIRRAQTNRQSVVDYLADKKVAGRVDQLKADLNEQRRLGNTGKAGEWIEQERGKG